MSHNGFFLVCNYLPNMAGASDEAAAEALSSGGFGSYDDKNDDGETTLHHFGKLGRMDMLLWINSKGCTDLINARDDVGGQVVGGGGGDHDGGGGGAGGGAGASTGGGAGASTGGGAGAGTGTAATSGGMVVASVPSTPTTTL